MERKPLAPSEMLHQIQSATHRSKTWADNHVKNAVLLLTDGQREEREKEWLCKSCFYLDRPIGGRAITTTNCLACSCEMVFSSTCTDKFCKKCSEDMNVCCRCGGDFDSRPRTSVFRHYARKAKKK